jgi:uncharacterized repeat protein (TIGR03803 family)
VRISRFGYAVSIGAAALFAGCGGSQPPIGAPAAMPLNRAVAQESDAKAPTYHVIFRFPTVSGGCPDGAWPWGGLVSLGGTLYGTTYAGGAHGAGTVFSMSTSGKLRVLDNFDHNPREGDGGGPEGALVAVNGTLYGTTPGGGKYGRGSVFSETTDGKVRVLHSFGKRLDGAKPESGLIAINAALYGTTSAGGTYRDGTVFTISTKDMSEKVLHSFGSDGDGQAPQASLIAVKGVLFGTTSAGGRYADGTVFRIGLSGEDERVLHSFASGSDGKAPKAAVTAVSDVLYGTTAEGGAYGQSNWGGTLFSISTAGKDERVLHSFGNGTDGQEPLAALIGVNGTLYGTTARGGAYAGSGGEGGTVYSFHASSETERVLHNFGRRSDGSIPVAPLTETDGTLYGTTISGGIYGECVTSGKSGNGAVFAFVL